MSKKVTLLEVATKLFYITAIFWFVFSIVWLFEGSDYSFFYFVNGLLFAIVLSVLGYNLGKKKLWAYRTSLFVLGINILLTFADQMGWFDFVYLIFAIVLFTLVVKQSKFFK